jgi:Ca-activated chloride channel family protein
MTRRKRAAVIGVGLIVATMVVASILGAFVLGVGDSAESAPHSSFGSSGDTVGLSAGGSQDANSFRSNVENGYVPQPSSLTYEGLYHDYYFETGSGRDCDRIFCPSYSRAVSRDPISGEPERYVAVGLNSGLRTEDFERPDLNLVVVVDTSGSMGSRFDEYHYDAEDEGSRPSKMVAARDALRTMTDHLRPGDRVGIVAFNHKARTVSRMRAVREPGAPRLSRRIDGLSAGGSTNLAAAMDRARRMADPHADREGTETRIIYITDAQPNTGDTGSFDLRSRLRSDADRGIHTTFVGVGMDFNSRLVETINDVEGANHYSVKSPHEFDRRMAQGFDYMVTPLVTDLSLSVESSGYDVEHAYGVPSANDAEPATRELIHVKTLFPSRKSGDETEGGVILLELEETDDRWSRDRSLVLTADYETPSGDRERVTRRVRFADHRAPYYESSGVRKAVVLTRYGTLMRNWMAYERARQYDQEFEPPRGIERRELGQWEQTSVSLRVSSPYDRRIEEFQRYFVREQRALGDPELDQDRRILERLVGPTDHRQETDAGIEPRDHAVNGEGVTRAAVPDGLTVTHRGGEELNQRRIRLSVRTDATASRAHGIGYDSATRTTDPLWNPTTDRTLHASDAATVRFYLVPGERIGGQSTTALIHGDAACGIRAAGDGRIVLTDRPAGTRHCNVDGAVRVPRSVGGALQPGDEVSVVWSPAGTDESQVLFQREVVGQAD